MPSHSHGYQKFRYDSTYTLRGEDKNCRHYPYSEKAYNYFENSSTTSEGGGKAHNNMPPYLTANCWRRTG